MHRGTLINVVGAPVAGYKLEFERNHVPSAIKHFELFPIGDVDTEHIVDSTDDKHSIDDVPRGRVESLAVQVKPPGVSRNYRGGGCKDCTGEARSAGSWDWVEAGTAGLINAGVRVMGGW